ncbi:MAG: flagellar biosynthetic protein FliR [Pseudobdellovibrionaceae bacterium]
MQALYQFPEGQIVAFALVFLRLIAFVVAWPVFGSASVPVYTKILLALVMSMVVFPTLSFPNGSNMLMGQEVMAFAAREIFIGLFLGFLMRMIFFAVSVSGEIMSVSIGIASAQLYNPAMGGTSNVVEQFQIWLATLFFLAMDGHHIFISGLVKSYEVVPLAAQMVNSAGFATVATSIQAVLVMGLKMAAPVLLAIFLANLAMGILGRAVPQINVLMTSLSVTISIGFVVMILAMPMFIGEMSGLIDVMAQEFFKEMKVL